MAREVAVLLAVVLLVAEGCAGNIETSPLQTGTPPGGATAPVPTTAPPASASPSPGQTSEPSIALAPAHRIAVREAGGRRELYEVTTGQPFLARGVMLLRKGLVGNRIYDTLFGSQYDSAWVDDEFTKLGALGYNTVRVFLDLCADDCIALPDGGLRSSYLDHVADFLGRARSHGIVVMPASNDLPDTPDYGYAPPCCSPFGGYRNSAYLSPEGHAAAERYWRDIVGGLIDRGAATDAVLAWELVNEQFTFLDAPPLSLGSGSVLTADGRSWDMASEEQRREMVDSNVTAFADRMRGAIRELDPTALVTMGFFAPNEPVEWRPGDNRFVLTRAVLEHSSLDFADLHAYPGGSFDVDDHLRQYGVTDAVHMPLLMGEMGAFKSTYASPAEGAAGLVAWQVESCRQFQGWLLWLEADTDDEVWGGAEGDGAIDEALSPRERPDPCAAGEFVRQNLAEGAAVRASNATAENPAEFAVDGAPGTQWIAGAGPPQWIEIDLGGPHDIAAIELLVAQFPNGSTRHRVLVGTQRGELRLVAALKGDTADGEVLVVDLDPDDGGQVRFVRIETTASPSWVAWREVRVIGR
jgi:hypothetical protein